MPIRYKSRQLYFSTDPMEISNLERENGISEDHITTTILDWDNAELSFESHLPIKLWLKLAGVYDYVLEMCSNKKVVHLAKYAKKDRVRTKNFNRAMKIIAKEA